MADLSEQAINKVAEMGLKSQLDEVEELEVEIQTDPLKMLSGEVDSVAIEGEGMVMQKDLRVEEMKLQTGNIAINPLSVAFGKIELKRPTDAETHAVLTEVDLNRAFNSEFIQDKMNNLQVHINGQPVTLNPQHVEFGLPGDGKVSLGTDVLLEETGETHRVAFTAVPRKSPDGSRVILEDVQYAEGKELSPELTEALLQQASELLNLRNFELQGMSLRLNKLDVQPGKLILEAQAHITEFPSE